MHCPNCGFQSLEGAGFCARCGASFVPAGPQTISAPHVPVKTAAATCYAGFWKRAGAFIIDTIILMIAGGIMGFIVGAIIGMVMAIMGKDLKEIQMAAGAVGYCMGLVLNWLYFTLFESSSRKATIGKMALGIFVSDYNNNRISFGRANARYFAKIPSALILGIGYFMAGFTEKKQALHDMIAGTLVSAK